MPKFNSVNNIPAKLFFDILQNKDFKLLELLENETEKELEETFVSIYDDYFVQSENHKSKEFLEERRALMHDTFEALYQQNPVLKTGNMFKVGMIEVVDSLPAGITQRVRGWDFASTIASGDATAGVKIEELNGIFLITDIIHFRGSPDEVETALVNTASLDGNRLLQSYPQDPGQAGKSQVAYLSKKLKGYKFEFTTENGNKETRADGFASQVNAGNVKMLRASWNYDYLEELRAFPFGKYDDRVDASSRAFNKLISYNDGVSSLLKKRIGR